MTLYFIIFTEAVIVEVFLVNPLKVQVVLSDVVLLWQFVHIDYLKSSDQTEESVDNELISPEQAGVLQGIVWDSIVF